MKRSLWDQIKAWNYGYSTPVTVPPDAPAPVAQDDVVPKPDAPVNPVAASPVEQAFSEMGIQVSVVEEVSGPVLDVVYIRPAAGVRGKAVKNVETDLARLLNVDSVRVVESGVGAGLMALEIARPKDKRKIVKFSECLEAEAWQNCTAELPIILGVDVRGKVVIADIAKFPHAIIAGTTGAGKSVGMKTMLLSLLWRFKSSDLRLLLIDPKRVSFPMINGLPHLVTPIVTDMEEAVHQLEWCEEEMERRYQLLESVGAEDVKEYNSMVSIHERLPRVVVVIDEYADMVMVIRELRKKLKKQYVEDFSREQKEAQLEGRVPIPIPEILRDVEDIICRLGQKARASGIHVLLGTQRPSVDIVTGLIKTNYPTRIAYLVAKNVDSRIILDDGGAECLLGAGDMLYIANGTSTPKRVHGAFIDNSDARDFVKKHCNSQPN